jgi:PKHD-type hydroxylase
METENAYWSWSGAFSKETCATLIGSYYKNEDAKSALVGHSIDGGILKPDTRSTKVCWISPDEHISSILLNKVLIANYKAGWNFDVDSVEPVQIAKYEPDSHYNWHTDESIISKTNGTQRKISIVVMLSDPSEYDGGALEFNQDHPTAVPNIQGSVYVFPSLVLHRVAPVTRGVRYSLTAWCRGPAFR